MYHCQVGRKKQYWTRGYVFTIGLLDGTVGLGQVLGWEPEALNSAGCAFFDYRFSETESISLETLDLSIDRAISAILVSRDSLDRHYWRVIGNCPVRLRQRDVPYEAYRTYQWVGSTTHGSGTVTEFLRAFHGLRFWDDWHDPHHLDTLLLSIDRRPRTGLIFKRQPASDAG